MKNISNLILIKNNNLLAILIELTSKLLPFILVPFITNAFVGKEYLDYLYYESMLFIFSTIITLGQDAAISRSALIHRKPNAIRVQGASLSLSIVFGSLFFISSILLQKYFIAFISLGAIIISMSNMISLVTIARADLKTYNISRLSNQLLAFNLTLLLLVLDSLSMEIRISFIIIGFIFSSVFLWPYLKNITIQNTFKNITLIKYSLGIGFFLLLHSLSNIARLRIDKVLFLDQIPITIASNIGLASIFILAISAFIDSVYKILLPNIYKSYVLENKSLRLTLFKLFFLGLFIAFIGFLFNLIPERFYIFIFGNSFNMVGYYIFIMTLSYIFFPAYLYFVNYAIFIKKTILLGFISVFSAIAWLGSGFFILKNGYSYNYFYISQIILFAPTIILFLLIRAKIIQ